MAGVKHLPPEREAGASSPWPFDRKRYTRRLQLHLPSSRAALDHAVDRVLEQAQHCGCSDDSQADLEIALREALANAIIHGNGGEEHRQVFLRSYGAPGLGVLVAVRDDGEGFDPEEVPDPRDADRMHLHHGRGLFLMRELMDWVEYRKNGREAVFFKSLER
ncbi:MAG TPA: ATP-binding protein [Candidatus Polarisedimenticolaceae bacterium]|nr:ATP-binding protein [Candidatus Polarisedimenticolaceae bacterium]